MIKIAAVVLAAGRSSRFLAGGGGEETKLLAKIEGKPIIAHVVGAALASRARPIVVVVGHAGEAVAAALAGFAATIAVNPDFETGIASSLRVGLASIPADVEGAVVLLGDMPNIAPRLIDELIHALEARPTLRAVVPIRQGVRGNPVLLGRILFKEAMRLVGDEGARRLLAAFPDGDIAEITTMTDVFCDVDAPDDLAAAHLSKTIAPACRRD